jgi:hypothetical protein
VNASVKSDRSAFSLVEQKKLMEQNFHFLASFCSLMSILAERLSAVVKKLFLGGAGLSFSNQGFVKERHRAS